MSIFKPYRLRFVNHYSTTHLFIPNYYCSATRRLTSMIPILSMKSSTNLKMKIATVHMGIQLLDMMSSRNTGKETISLPRVQPIDPTLRHLPTHTVPLSKPMAQILQIMATSISQLRDRPIGHILRIMVTTTMPIQIKICTPTSTQTLILMKMCIPTPFRMTPTRGSTSAEIMGTK